jgi:DNA-binding transcriptional regulator YdaS (Cro superfamily)
MEHHDHSIAPEAATDEPASSTNLTDFDPAPLRYRQDGLTPEKQRDYVEALADTGIAREAAARIGVSEQAVNRVRRRADARSFDLACEAALRFAARRIRSIAFERAIEGTIKRHYYHGELKSEERVYDNRLLVYLLGKLDRQLAPPAGAEAVAGNWEPWMAAIEQGLPAPLPSEDEEPEADEEPTLCDRIEVWQENGEWWTEFPPPAGFDGIEEGEPGGYDYKRTLSEAELAVVEADEAEERAQRIAEQSARRDQHFGFEGGNPDDGLFSPRGPETNETSVADAEERRASMRARPVP